MHRLRTLSHEQTFSVKISLGLLGHWSLNSRALTACHSLNISNTKILVVGKSKFSLASEFSQFAPEGYL